MEKRSQAMRQHASLIALLLVGSACCTVLAEQQVPTVQDSPATTRPNFTGNVGNLDAANIRVSRLIYEAGARSYWHVHEGYQILLVEKGRGLVQVQGQRIRELSPGEPAFLPAGVPHWHGAAPDQGLTWIAVSVAGSVKWMKPVTEEEYLSKAW